MRVLYVIFTLFYGLAAQASVIVFSSLDPTSTSSAGAFNGLTKVSDIAQISSTAGEIEQIRISIATSSGGTGTYKVHFHSLLPGADGLLHTNDDRLGALLGSWASQNAIQTSNSLLTLTGSAVTVPQTFVWILEKESIAPSFSVYTTPLENFGLGYSNARTMFWNTTASPLLENSTVFVDNSSPYTYNYQIEIISVPEPTATALMIFFAFSGLAVRRLIRKP